MGSLMEKITYLEKTKEEIKKAIVAKGVPVDDADTLRSYASKIDQILGTTPTPIDPEVPGEPNTLDGKIKYLNYTKKMIQASIEGAGQEIDDTTPFRAYVTKIKNIFPPVPFYSKIIEDSPIKGQVSDDTMFASISPADGSQDGLWLENRDGKTLNNSGTYFFRGGVQNNYVRFGGFYWRIIRINENGSVKMIYAGDTAGSEEGYTQYSFFSNAANISPRAGYVFINNEQRGHANSNTIKLAIEEWYEDNLLAEYDSFICPDTFFYTERAVCEGDEWSKSGASFDYLFRHNASASTPSFISVSTSDELSKTNGRLAYPVGLITGDEVIYAGGQNSVNNERYYLRENSPTKGWWTMTPGSWSENETLVSVVMVDDEGSIQYSTVAYGRGVRPVISLKPTLLWSSGDGTVNNPYQVKQG